MRNEAKETISFRVSPELKENLIDRAEENGFDSLSQYLEQLIRNAVDQPGTSKLNNKDLYLIKRTLQTELHKKVVPPLDPQLEVILDNMMEKLVPKAASTMLNTYSTENFTREDLKASLFEYLKRKIDEKDLILVRIIRTGLRR